MYKYICYMRIAGFLIYFGYGIRYSAEKEPLLSADQTNTSRGYSALDDTSSVTSDSLQKTD